MWLDDRTKWRNKLRRLADGSTKKFEQCKSYGACGHHLVSMPARIPAQQTSMTTADKIALALSAVLPTSRRTQLWLIWARRKGDNPSCWNKRLHLFSRRSKRVGMPAMCEDKVAMQWNKDRAEHRPGPTTKVPGIEYMLAGATQRSDIDPFDKVSPPSGLARTG